MEEPDKPIAEFNESKVLHTPRRQIRLRTTVMVALLAAFFSALITTGGIAGLYLLERTASNSFEEQRQVVVQEGDVIADVAQRVGPSVVSIVTKQQTTGGSSYFQPSQSRSAAGTGIILDADGLVLTNKHVVPTGTTSLQVVLSDGTSYDDVVVIGRDPLNDIAILKINSPKKLVAAKLGDSDTVRTGQKVIAIGNALGQFQNSVTSGIVSGMGRPIEAGDANGSHSEQLVNLFQTDAAINPGNSGGPLVNFQGEVIGINTAIAEDAQNIGFSIPVNEAKGIISGVKATGKVVRPYLGVRYMTITPDTAAELNLGSKQGAYISTDSDSIVADGPAAKAGLKGGDIITRVGDISLSDKVSLSSAIGRFKAGDSVSLTVLRGDKQQQIKVTLEAAPAE